MNQQHYETYKDSDIPWLGKIPAHWEATFIKRKYSVQLGKMLQPSAKRVSDTQEKYLRAANIQWSGVDDSDIKTMWFSAHDKEQYALQQGDLLISEGGDVGRASTWDGRDSNVYIQNAINRVRGINTSSSRFLFYWVFTIKHSGLIDVICNKSTIPHYTAEKVERTRVPFPPLPEQQAIAAYLDERIAKLDKLIANKREQIKQLETLRKVTIHDAVTKGLNPDTPMKDSGIAWLGEVPKHWKVKRLKHGVDLMSNKTEDYAKGLTYLGLENIESWTGKYLSCMEDDKYEAESNVSLFSVDDVLFGKLRPYLAKVYCCLLQGVCSTEFLVLRGTKLLPIYLQHLLLSATYINEINAATYGTKMPRANWEIVSSLPVAFPPLSEQQAIATYLNERTANLDQLIANKREQIKQIETLRKVTIHDAVTGNINVSGLGI